MFDKFQTSLRIFKWQTIGAQIAKITPRCKNMEFAVIMLLILVMILINYNIEIASPKNKSFALTWQAHLLHFFFRFDGVTHALPD